MGEVRILTEAELRQLVPLDLAAVDCVENAFAALAGGKVEMPPILSMPVHEHNGEIDVKTAYVPGLDGFAVKMSPGFFDNPKIGLPSTSGLMVVFSATTGVLQALLLDNGWLTDVRTAAAGAVAAKHLAREDASTVAILGAGAQAKLQLEALTLVRGIQTAAIWARDIKKAEKAAAEMSTKLGIEVTAKEELRDAISGADIIVTTTPSTAPLIEAEWLEAGQHLTAMGSDQPGKGELQPDCLTRADLYVPDRLAQCVLSGELHNATEAGLIASDQTFAELGNIVTGDAKGRSNSKEITICDLTGTGVQDTAISTLAFERAIAANAGTIFNS